MIRLASTDAAKKYRSELGIISDILDTIAASGRQGINVSAIARAANVSYNTINQKCQKLVDAGFVDSQKSKNKTIYFITPSGIEFLERLRGFTEAIRAMDIRC
jgi:predicted transcriptional regulator